MREPRRTARAYPIRRLATLDQRTFGSCFAAYVAPGPHLLAFALRPLLRHLRPWYQQTGGFSRAIFAQGIAGGPRRFRSPYPTGRWGPSRRGRLLWHSSAASSVTAKRIRPSAIIGLPDYKKFRRCVRHAIQKSESGMANFQENAKGCLSMGLEPVPSRCEQIF